MISPRQRLNTRLSERPDSEFRGQSRVDRAHVTSLCRGVARWLEEARRFRPAGRRDLRRLFELSATRRIASVLVYLLAATATNERINVRVFVNEPDLTMPSVVPLVGGGQLDGARSVRHVRHPLRRAIPTCAHPDAGGVHRLPVAQGLSAARARRTAQFPGAYREIRRNGGSRSCR